MMYKQTMESNFFEEWFKEIFLKDLEKIGKKVLIIMDNAKFHRKINLSKIVAGTQHLLKFLPPYSPDLNPIEKVWAIVKKRLRNKVNNSKSFVDIIGEVLSDYNFVF